MSMELNIAISPSEKQVAKIIGSDNWSKITKRVLEENAQKCFYCGYPSRDENNKVTCTQPKLNIHLLPFAENLDLKNDFSQLDAVIVCDACHAIQHFDYAVKNNWLKLVNSSFNQIDLLKICRWSNRMVNAYILGGHRVEKQIFPLKKTPESYLEEIKESDLNINKKIKVIFTKNFDWTSSR
jgi:hypothetical protein